MTSERSPSSGQVRRRKSRVARSAWLALATAAYIAYLALLITCDLLSASPRGFVPRFGGGAMTVTSVVPESRAAQSGLADGDRILRANGQTLRRFSDWQRVAMHFDPSQPLILEIDRDGRRRVATLTLPVARWQGLGSVGVLAYRSAQVVTLGLAMLVAFRRSFKAPALLGALMLASMATVSLALPMRMAAFWKALPNWIEWVLWVPFTTSAAVGPLLFAFVAVFPRRVWSKTTVAAAMIPGAAAAGWYLYLGRELMRDLGPPIDVPGGAVPVFLVNVIYAVLTVVLLVTHRRAASTLTDQRRIGVLIVGTATGAAAAAAVIVAYWRNPGAGVFEKPWMTALALVCLAMPASFAYAILRHRLLDVRLIVRQGLRYALARRFVDALIPLLGAVLLLDVVLHREQPVASLAQARWWWYALLGAAVLLVRSRREAWLRSIDRRFFRDRYDAQRLLTSIADQVARASSVEAIAPVIAHQIDEALHPTFVTVLRHIPAQSIFAGGSGHVAETTPSQLPSSLTVIAVLTLLRKPLALSLGDTAWVRHQLPLEERALLVKQGIELLVPVSGRVKDELPLGLLVLGPRRSEEPYNQEDLDLLSTIADALGALLERSAGDSRGFAECEQCGGCFEAAVDLCPNDRQPLRARRGTRLLNQRYRLESRLGRGGMGIVYSAVDTVLERQVAVKVITEEFSGPLDLSARFRHEARAAAGFAHPHVVRVYDFGVDRSNRAFLVMELLEGETLRQRLASGVRLDVSEVLTVLRGVCSALDAAHARGLVHRDLKPENIFLQRHASAIMPKVLDFGLAKVLDSARRDDEATGMATSAGVLLGTVEYMAPEQIAGDTVSPTWDLWALGVITYEMLTGAHPFRRGAGGRMSPASSVTAAVADDQRPLLSPQISTFFDRALSPDPTARPAGAIEFVTRIEQVLI